MQIENHSDKTVLKGIVQQHRSGQTLPRDLYVSEGAFRVDIAAFFNTSWLFVCHASELPKSGNFQRFDVADTSVIILRGRDNEIRALHNVCRHRGARLCEKSEGRMPNIVCPYHQWIYDLTGALTRAEGMDDDFDLGAHNVRQAHCSVIEGCVFVCLAEDAPDASHLGAAFAPYMRAQGIGDAKVAHVSTIIEEGNWKLTWENYHECYHCDNGHPELSRTFPVQPVAYGGGADTEDRDFVNLWNTCDRLGLPRDTLGADDGIEHRLYRRPLLGDSMTMSGEPAVSKYLGGITENGIGDVSVLHHPNMFGHMMADHAVFMRIRPLASNRTALQTRWLVDADAVEGVDYNVETLTEVWKATNQQDARFVRLSHEGIGSPAYVPGPYSPTREISPRKFADWYCKRLAAFLD
ncbi:aromatic ring-hydroxylating oxygenase subunit alpha [Roseovarius sp. 2305UL8-3]|uniref:aromatic ring-hydroxylating oxygenase subunit alpha n=1 Tax=Roseovarius conchicola TaxID=3121636 RepID=UPI003528EC59